MQLTADFKSESKKYFKLLLPLLGTNLIQMGIGVVDVIMLGNYSNLSLAGAALASGLWFNIMLFFSGICWANGTICAHYFGEKKFDRIGQTIWYTLVIALIGGAIAFIIVQHVHYLFEIFGVQENIGKTATSYLYFLSFSTLPFLWFNGLRAVCESTNKASIVTYIYAVVFLLNILINYTLIYGNFGFPEMGEKGAAIASLIVTWLLAAGVLVFVLTSSLAKKIKPWPIQKTQWSQFKEYLWIGIPSGIAIFIELSMFGGISLLVARFNPEIASGHQIAMNIASVAFMIPLALGLAATIRIGQLLGEKQLIKLPIALKSLATWTFGIMLFNCTALYFLREVWVDFYTDDPRVFEVALQMLLVAVIFQVFDILQCVLYGVMRGFKRTFFASVAAFVSYWLIGIPLGYLLTFPNEVSWIETIGPVGLWWGMVTSLIVVSLLYYIRVHTIYLKEVKNKLAQTI